MNLDRMKSIVEELQEVQTMAELKAIHCMGGEYADAVFTAPFKQAVKRLRPLNIVVETPTLSKLEQLEQELAILTASYPKPPVQRIPRAGNKYRLLSTNISWTTKPQVQALMQILEAHAKPGDVLDEGDIVRMMVANESVLKTRQGGKKIWDYYKGDHFEGLSAHKNVEKA